MAKEKEQTVPKKSAFRDTIDSIVVAFVIAMIIRALFIQAFKIPSGSMLDTLQIGDHILVNKLSYLFSDPEHDDIIVFEYPLEPDKDYIKRVIGVPGDKIRIEDKVVYRNGVKLEPDYTRFEYSSSLPASISPRDNIEEFTVPEGAFFVMGDNRDASFDGRFWGLVDKDSIVGRAFIIYWSWGGGGTFNVRFDRILDLL
ncbi:MAG: signal peptidase I [Deferribacterales bacterium]|nr:signal peptidase I [Deferribacterales bacterium]